MFAAAVAICDAQGLIGREMFAIDGVKLPSNASKRRSGTRADFERQATKLETTVQTMLAGDTAGARAEATRAIELDPTFYESHHQLGWLEMTAGNLELARAEIDRARTLAGGDYSWRPIVDRLIRKASGDTAGVRALLRGLDHDPRFAQRAALVHALGDTDSAFVLLDRALATRDADALLVVMSIPEVYPLHGDPRHERFRRRMGLSK